MWRKKLAVVGAGASWGVCTADLLPGIPLWLSVEQQAFALSVALIASAWLLLCAWRRPLGAVYRDGFEHGRQYERAQLDGPDDGCTVVPLRRTSETSRGASRWAIDA